MKKNKLSSIIDNHYYWLNPLFILLTTLSSALVTYTPKSDFQKLHPIRFAFYELYKKYDVLILVVSAVVLAIITIVNTKNQKTIKKIEEDLKKYREMEAKLSENIKELFSGYLYQLSKAELAFSPNERITIYIHNGYKHFIPFARYSLNATYSKSGRELYPDNCGCIAKGWNSEWFFYTFKAPNDTEDYLRETQDCFSIDSNTLEKINMKSVLYAVMRIDTLSGKPIGLIVVESTDKNKYTERQIKRILEKQRKYLAEMILTFYNLIPAPHYAASIERR